MTFNVNDFSANMNKNGFGRSAHYQVRCYPPGYDSGAGTAINMPEVQAELSFRTDSVTLPGRGALTTEMHTYGPPQSMAYESQYPPVEMTVMLSPDNKEREYFQRWQDIAVGSVRNGAQNGRGQGSLLNSQNGLALHNFDIGYYIEYAGVVNILTYNVNGDNVYICRLYEAWPATISGINLNWGENDINKLLVGFRYRYYVEDIFDVDYSDAVSRQHIIDWDFGNLPEPPIPQLK